MTRAVSGPKEAETGRLESKKRWGDRDRNREEGETERKRDKEEIEADRDIEIG